MHNHSNQSKIAASLNPSFISRRQLDRIQSLELLVAAHGLLDAFGVAFSANNL